MLVCPVCENSQPHGDTCDNCGKQLSAPVEAPVTVERMPDMEATALRENAGPVTPDPMVDLERTAMPPVEALPMDAPPEMESGRAEADASPRTAEPTGDLTCRYCRHVQAEGALCDQCGMRLTKLAPLKAAKVVAEKDWVWSRCRKCGGRNRAGMVCNSCGDFVPPVSS